MRIAALALKRKHWEPFAFASPSLVLIALVIVFPLVYAFYLSLQNFDLSVGADYQYIGGRNYVEALFRDQRFLGSVWNTALIIVPSLAVALVPLAVVLGTSRQAVNRKHGGGWREGGSDGVSAVGHS